jgi:hypothetical protein
MRQLTEAFPDAKTLLAIEPEELGDVILELAHADGPGAVMFSMTGFMEPVNNRISVGRNRSSRPRRLRTGSGLRTYRPFLLLVPAAIRKGRLDKMFLDVPVIAHPDRTQLFEAMRPSE